MRCSKTAAGCIQSAMKHIITLLLLVCVSRSLQAQTAEKYGFRHLQFTWRSSVADILVKSKEGEESVPKPLFFFCQGSGPQPLIKLDEQGMYGVFPFNPDSLTAQYHLVIVSKPFIPLVCDVKHLGANFSYLDSTGLPPRGYSEHNLPDYYVHRNIAIIKFLQQQRWVSSKQLIMAGHSEGSTIAARTASISPLVTRLIYSGGNPMGRILSMIRQSRSGETDTDSTRYGEQVFEYWEDVVKHPGNMDASQGDTYKATYEFSDPPIGYLQKLKIPVLVCYGTKDWSAPYNDLLRVDMIRKGKANFSFKAYVGTEHNYFPLTAEGRPDHTQFNWDRVAGDWRKWLNSAR
jgi:dienelactone hydrolase